MLEGLRSRKHASRGARDQRVACLDALCPSMLPHAPENAPHPNTRTAPSVKKQPLNISTLVCASFAGRIFRRQQAVVHSRQVIVAHPKAVPIPRNLFSLIEYDHPLPSSSHSPCPSRSRPPPPPPGHAPPRHARCTQPRAAACSHPAARTPASETHSCTLPGPGARPFVLKPHLSRKCQET